MLTCSSELFDNNINNLTVLGKRFIVEQKRNNEKIILNGKYIAKRVEKNHLSNISGKEKKTIVTMIGNVKKQVMSHIIKSNFDVEIIDRYSSSTYINRHLLSDLKKGTRFILVDVNHCYWRIAYLLGYISKNFYKKTYRKKHLKYHRNIALACIVAPTERTYHGYHQQPYTITEENSLFRQVYKNICHTAWNIMWEIAQEIGPENCLGYRTDGIMVFPGHTAVVKKILRRNKLTFSEKACGLIDQSKYYNHKLDIKKF